MRLIFVVVLGSAVQAAAAALDDAMKIIAAVESRNNDSAVGDQGRALGRYQLHRRYVADANRTLGTKYAWRSAHNKTKAERMVKGYLKAYGRQYRIDTGRAPTVEVYLRIHNGGPDGWSQWQTDNYINRCAPVARRLRINIGATR